MKRTKIIVGVDPMREKCFFQQPFVEAHFVILFTHLLLLNKNAPGHVRV
jgi:hypothetical protein